MNRLTLIVAATKTNGIGRNSQLPWRLPREMSYFAKVTSHAPEGKVNVVVMGRNTWESIPTKFKPLANRINVVVSRNIHYQVGLPGVHLHSSLGDAIIQVTTSPTHKIFIIGGASLYEESLGLLPSPGTVYVDRVLLTRILSPAFEDCDTFMPNFVGKEENSEWVRAPHDELESWVGFEVPMGIQTEKGVEYEFQMWTRP